MFCAQYVRADFQHGALLGLSVGVAAEVAQDAGEVVPAGQRVGVFCAQDVCADFQRGAVLGLSVGVAAEVAQDAGEVVPAGQRVGCSAPRTCVRISSAVRCSVSASA